MNDGFVPERDDMKTLSVSLDTSVLPFNQVTLTEISLSTAALIEILQATDKFVPAYKVPLGKTTLMLGVGTASIHHINVHLNLRSISDLTCNDQRVILHYNK